MTVVNLLHVAKSTLELVKKSQYISQSSPVDFSSQWRIQAGAQSARAPPLVKMVVLLE